MNNSEAGVSIFLFIRCILDCFRFSLWKHTTEESFVRDDIGLGTKVNFKIFNPFYFFI